MRNTISLRRVLPAALGGLMSILIVLLIHRDYPFAGHDYRYFISRLIDTNIHLRLHGLSIQWYTPSFGGGLPAFPNPQHLEYSIVQWVSFLIGPWPAVLLTTVAISWIGYYFCYLLLHEELGVDWKASTLGAMFFLGNGFYIEHMIVGQLGYQLFPLAAVILYFLLNSKNRVLTNAIASGLLTALMVYQAGFYLIIIIALSYTVALPIVYLYRPALIDVKGFFQTLMLAGLFGTLLSAAKLNAVFALMSHFPRQIFDTYSVGIFQAFLGLIAQLLGVMVLAPILMLTGQNTDFLSGALSNITGAVYGIWELDTGLSPVLILFLLAAAARLLGTRKMRTRPKLEKKQIYAVLFLVGALWLVIELTFAKGLIYPLLRDLPILRSLHVNVRFASALIFPLVVLGSFLIDGYFKEHPNFNLFLIASLCSLLALIPFFFLSPELHSREFKVPTQQNIQNVRSFNVLEVSDLPDWEVFRAHASSYRPYEPLFGYKLETFDPMIHPGSIFDVQDGYFNMTNPASLVFPEINHLSVFERIKAGERDKLEAFAQYGQPKWKIPGRQRFLNILSLLTLFLILCWMPFVQTTGKDKKDKSISK